MLIKFSKSKQKKTRKGRVRVKTKDPSYFIRNESFFSFSSVAHVLQINYLDGKNSKYSATSTCVKTMLNFTLFSFLIQSVHFQSLFGHCQSFSDPFVAVEQKNGKELKSASGLWVCFNFFLGTRIFNRSLFLSFRETERKRQRANQSNWIELENSDVVHPFAS